MSSNFAKVAVAATLVAATAGAAAPAVGAAAAGGAAATGAAASTATATGILGTGLTAGKAIGLAGAGLSAYGRYQQGQAQKQEARYNASIQETNALIQKQNAELARQSAGIQASRIRKQTQRRLATMRAAFTRGGVVSSEGSPLLAVAEQAGEGRMEEENILYQGNLEAGSQTFQSNVSRMRAGALRQEGSAAGTRGTIGAATTLLTGASGILT